MEMLPVGTALIGKTALEISAAGGNVNCVKEGETYYVLAHDHTFGDDIVVSRCAGTFSMEPDDDGHSYKTFFTVKGE